MKEISPVGPCKCWGNVLISTTTPLSCTRIIAIGRLCMSSYFSMLCACCWRKASSHIKRTFQEIADERIEAELKWIWFQLEKLLAVDPGICFRGREGGSKWDLARWYCVKNRSRDHEFSTGQVTSSRSSMHGKISPIARTERISSSGIRRVFKHVILNGAHK